MERARNGSARLAGKVLAADVAIMVTGTALGQAASIVLAPVLTRLRTPDPFGSLSVNMAGLTIFVLIGRAGLRTGHSHAASEVELADDGRSAGDIDRGDRRHRACRRAACFPTKHWHYIWLDQLASERYLLRLGFA